jgi:hypothetical protein
MSETTSTVPTFASARPRMRARALACALVLALFVAGCCAAAPSGPAGVVQQALELRRDRVSDAKRYDALFADATIGAQLAKDSEAATVSPLPTWSPPYVSEESSAAAKVVVLWSPPTEPRVKDWPKATIFALQLTKGAWLIVDAETATGTVPPAK